MTVTVTVTAETKVTAGDAILAAMEDDQAGDAILAAMEDDQAGDAILAAMEDDQVLRCDPGRLAARTTRRAGGPW